MARNVATFLWRTLFLQAICRHYYYTGFELISVPLLSYMMLPYTQVVPLGNGTEEEDLGPLLAPSRPLTYVVFGPNTSYNEELMTAVDGLMRQVLNVTTQNGTNSKNEEENVHLVAAGDLPEPVGEPAAEFSKMASVESVAETCRRLAGTGGPRERTEALCVWFPTPPDAATAASLTYTLFVPVRNVAEKKTAFPLGQSFEEDRDISRAVSQQFFIEFSHVMLQAEKQKPKQADAAVSSEKDPMLKLGSFPGWVFGAAKGSYKEEINTLVLIVFLIPMVRRINAIEREFSSGLAEHQGVMGLTDMEFFLGHFLTIMITCFVEGSSVVAVMFYSPNEGLEWAHGMDPSLLAFTFVVFVVSFSLQVIMLTWIFPKGWIAVTAGILGTFVPSMVTEAAQIIGLPKYFLLPKWQKLVAGVFPTSGLMSVLRIIAITRDYENGGGWSVVAKKALGIDNVTIVEIWLIMMLSIFAMALAAWYFSKVLPWSTDNPQRPVFFLMAGYWKPSESKSQDATPDAGDPARFEEFAADTPTVIVAKNLTKVYGHVPALNGLDLRIYESKITVLLGHNGAGKSTLMSVLTGMQAPTSGAAQVCGYDVATHRSNVRQLVSFCQQTDIFFEDMTCVENLLYFGSLKGVPMDQLRPSIASTLQVVDLQDKAYSLPGELSGGMKRRLSIAITIVSQPKLLILDEPTAGMDPETRRNVWDTLQSVAKEKTLLLSSHDMEEADAIGDQVVVMASGRAICSGSTAFLKKACGVGYKVVLGKVPDAFKLKEVLAVVEKAVPTATVEEEKQGEVTIALKTLQNSGFAAMFGTLEKSSKELGIENIGVTVASMKDVYLKINLDWAPEGKTKESPVEQADIDAVAAPIDKQRTMGRVFVGLFIKRSISLIRGWSILLGCVALPLGLLALIGWRTPLPSLASERESDVEINTVPVSLAAHYPDSVFALGESPATKVSEKLRVLAESECSRVRSATDVRNELSVVATGDFANYISTYSMAVAFGKDKVTLMPNPTSAIALPVLLNMLTTSMLRDTTGQPLARINPTFAYIERAAYEGFGVIDLYRLIVWLYWAFVPALSYSLGFAAYSAFPVPERLGGARQVQLMTGMWGAEYVFAHFVFDMLHHAVFAGAWCLIHFAFSDYSIATAGHYYMVFLWSGPAIIGMAYLIAERAVSTGGAISSLLLWVYLGGAVSAFSSGFVGIILSAKSTHNLFMVFPPYTILSCFTKIWMADARAAECDLLESNRRAKERVHYGKPAAAFAAGDSLLLASSEVKTMLSAAASECKAISLYAFKDEAIGFEILALLATGLVCLGILLFLTSGFLPPTDMLAGKEILADEDVEAEKKLIASLRDKKDFSAHTMLAWSLHKRFGDLRAVRGLYVALKPSESFGLLGVNGAGKTTTFQMLAGLESVSYGDAMTKTCILSENVRKWQSQISYCFQVGGLLDKLNAYEYLYLIGRLRGIREADLKSMVDGIVNVVDLKEHAWKECGVYSGGNRRKLSIGAALLGLQPFVFLDEPYAGVDVVSRNKIFRAIAAIKKKSQTSFMLTSHNMDECEFSCDRLTIMVEGQMMCLGTLQHLREKFGRGFRMGFMLKHTAAADAGRLAVAVEKQFSGIKLTDAHENVLCYHLEERVPWSTLFTKLANLEEQFALEHALVGENTLEQIFLSFAKTQRVGVQPDKIGQRVVAPPPVVLKQSPSNTTAASTLAFQATAI